MRRWQNAKQFSAAEFSAAVHFARTTYPIELPTEAALDRALDLFDRYSLNHWDSMLLAACLEAGVTVLYTEDMGSPTKYDGLELKNPFL